MGVVKEDWRIANPDQKVGTRISDLSLNGMEEWEHIIIKDNVYCHVGMQMHLLKANHILLTWLTYLIKWLQGLMNVIHSFFFGALF